MNLILHNEFRWHEDCKLQIYDFLHADRTLGQPGPNHGSSVVWSLPRIESVRDSPYSHTRLIPGHEHTQDRVSRGFPYWLYPGYAHDHVSCGCVSTGDPVQTQSWVGSKPQTIPPHRPELLGLFLGLGAGWPKFVISVVFKIFYVFNADVIGFCCAIWLLVWKWDPDL